MDTSLIIFALLVVWIGFIFVGALLLMRMNAQVRRVTELPGESRGLKTLKDFYEDLDTRVRSNKIATSANADELDEVHRRIRSIQARDAAMQRREEKVDTVKLADYLLAVEPESQEAAEPVLPANSLAQDADGNSIDFR